MKPAKIKTPPEKSPRKEKPTAANIENRPNADTLAAMEELKAGKGKKFMSVAELFNSI